MAIAVQSPFCCAWLYSTRGASAEYPPRRCGALRPMSPESRRKRVSGIGAWLKLLDPLMIAKDAPTTDVREDGSQGVTAIHI